MTTAAHVFYMSDSHWQLRHLMTIQQIEDQLLEQAARANSVMMLFVLDIAASNQYMFRNVMASLEKDYLFTDFTDHRKS